MYIILKTVQYNIHLKKQIKFQLNDSVLFFTTSFFDRDSFTRPSVSSGRRIPSAVIVGPRLVTVFTPSGKTAAAQ